MSVVLDTSMTITWFFETETSDLSLSLLRRVTEEGAYVPSLWRLEVANVFRNAIRRGRCDESYVDRCLKRLEQLPIMIDADTDKQAWGQTYQLACAHNLTLYDAAYLELAMRCNKPLASYDTALINAARSLKLEVLSAEQ
jgi:predicted nucleic acid-binding protein